MIPPVEAVGHKPTVLLVDDSEFLTELILHYVRHYMADAGVDVLTAGDGPSALKIIEQKKPDVILLDIMMPGMDGLALFREIRKNEENKNIKVVFLTALDGPAERQTAKELGANGYMLKPADPTVLINLLKSLLS